MCFYTRRASTRDYTVYRFIPNVYRYVENHQNQQTFDGHSSKNPNRKKCMPSLIHPTTIRFPIILAYYFINAIVWISDFKPLHLEGDVDVHKYYFLGTLQPGNSASQITLFILSISENL